ncbi:putative odorant receptor 65b isoform X1 [Drosophila sechellia]|uniref:Odorant receptor n=1 Tax=Drosophila sechellia TaxID=7238 RepID=B4HUT7_DROSE|nr:putative odorant receptor 65b isoform X1 [Drosophila sechellia]EDW50708.1 GM14777 [Drosophila sechellia]
MDIQRFLKFFKVGWRIYRDPLLESSHSSIYYWREQMKAMALFTTTEERLLPYRSTWHTLVNIQIVIYFASMAFGLTESIGDHVQMGRDLAFILGAFFIMFKTYYFCWYGDELDQVISDLDALHPWAQKGPHPVEYQTGKRWYFVMAFFLATLWSFFLCIFLLLLITSPMWVHQQNLPFHAAFPFQWHDKSLHPISHAMIYLFQSYFAVYCLTWLLCIEGLSVFIYAEITFGIEVLCLELRHIHRHNHGPKELRMETNRLVKLHQKIVEILDRTNDVFHGTLIMQMGVNFSLVSLSVLEAVEARKDPKVVAQFAVLMLLALGHLSMWSYCGDLLSQKSLQISEAAYEAYDPTKGSKDVYRDLCVIMTRGQKPMIMRANPFPSFNLINYSAILNQCYGILTFLLKTLD